MTSDHRSLLPRISRAWSARQGRMVWWCDPLPHGKWGLGVSQQAHYDWRQAQIWCHQKNVSTAKLTEELK